jgi:hypothetical protein
LWFNRAIGSRTLIDVLDNSTKSLSLSWAPSEKSPLIFQHILPVFAARRLGAAVLF